MPYNDDAIEAAVKQMQELLTDNGKRQWDAAKVLMEKIKAPLVSHEVKVEGPGSEPGGYSLEVKHSHARRAGKKGPPAFLEVRFIVDDDLRGEWILRWFWMEDQQSDRLAEKVPLAFSYKDNVFLSPDERDPGVVLVEAIAAKLARERTPAQK